MAYDSHTGQDVGSVTSIDQYAGYGTAFLNPDRFRLDMSDRIHMLGPSSSPLLSWMQYTRSRSTGTYSFSWIESELFTQRDLKCRLIRTAEFTASGDDCLYALKLDTAADWQSFMAAAKADQWTSTEGDAMPLVYLTVIKPSDPTKSYSAWIKPNALRLGMTTRDILYADDSSTALSGALNAITLYDNAGTPGAGNDVGGAADELGEITASPAGLTVDFTNFASDFDDTFFGGNTDSERAADVWVSVATPNDFLKGFVQGSGLPTESRKRTRSLRNLTQIFKTPYSMSGTMIQVGANGMLIGGDEMQRRRYNKGVEHKVDIETAILFQGGGVEGTDWGELPGGTRLSANGATGGPYGSQISSSENPLTRFKGLGVGLAVNGLTTKPGWIQTKNCDLDSRYVFDVSAAGSSGGMDELNRLLGLVFDDNVDNPNNAKMLLCSQKWLTTLASLGLKGDGNGMFIFGQRVAAPGQLGIEIREIVTPVGRLDAVMLPRLRGKYEDYAVVLDMSNMEYRPMSGRNTMLKANVATEEIDGQVDYYLTEAGFECHHESTHAVLKLG